MKYILAGVGLLTSIHVWLSLAGVFALTSPFLSVYTGVHTGIETHDYRRVFPGGLWLWIASCSIPFLWFGLAFLSQSRFIRIRWLLVLMCFSQWFLARALTLYWEQFKSQREIPLGIEVWPTFAEVRSGLPPFQRAVYTPVLYLIERGYGVFALLLHSLVLAAIAAGIVYAVTRIYQRWHRPPGGGETTAEATPDADSATNHV